MSRDYYDAQRADGEIYQDFIVDLLLHAMGLAVVQYASRTYQIGIGESRTGVEIKHDKSFARTGNLWIEVAEKRSPTNPDWIPSGIDRPDNAWLFVIGDFDTVFGLPVVTLRLLRDNIARYPTRANDRQTSLGFLLDVGSARRYAAFVLTPHAADRIGDLRAAAAAGTLAQRLHAALDDVPAQLSLFRERE